MSRQIPSLNEFLMDRRDQPTRHIVIGSQAGDTDSVVASIALAYIESSSSSSETTPVLSISRRDFETQRPETVLLLKLAGISSNASEQLIFADSTFIRGVNVTLVDHNRLEERFRDKQWTVVEILDHHYDEEQYLDTCFGESRCIAFANGKALVASACTLVAERMKKLWTPLPYPASLGTLLLGTILLDSVNMDPAAGKFTDRDGDAVRDILYHTDWSTLDKKTKQILKVSERPDPDAFYHALESARFDLVFWRSLSMNDTLRLDYKRYAYESNEFGVSTVLMPYQEFVREMNLVEGIRAYMLQEQVNFLGIMLTSMDGNVFQRQLALCAFDSFPLRDMVQFLLQTDDHEQEVLGLVELDESMITEDGLTIRFFDQSNAKASRKQIAPSLLEFFAQSSI